ncbi:hypothetical protein [Propionimicrobium sp. PCR01-08-3]|uniref:hypothetical protein n=1 Tax=Propionimicrobium sp. PCR01-08-3 TaxID=3052086 RepID=UPI00255CEC06|nr:hypothetical protein [Propionimicrobium sp. PCR01-08-3]WIY83020.1 hypothetical protein QQ658_01250 [Propionimicrobium sp. PCR01-08-3]
MRGRYTNWQVSGYIRPEHDEHGNLIGNDSVVQITEPQSGWQWHIVLTPDRKAIADFRIRNIGRPQLVVDTDALAQVPLRDLVDMAKVYLSRVDTEFTDGQPVFLALTLAELEPGEARIDGMPTPEEYAAAWQELGPQTVSGIPRRDALAARYGVTVWTIDKWTKNARQRGLIAEARVGRGNRRRPSRHPQD